MFRQTRIVNLFIFSLITWIKCRLQTFFVTACQLTFGLVCSGYFALFKNGFQFHSKFASV